MDERLTVFSHFNNISVISGLQEGDNERMCIGESGLRLKNSFGTRGLEPKTAISAGLCLNSELPGLMEQPRKSRVLDNPDKGAV